MKLKELNVRTDVEIKNKDEYLVLMDLAEKAGYKWVSGDRPTFFNDDKNYISCKKIRIYTNKTIIRLPVEKSSNVSLNEIIEFENGDKVRVKKFDERPRNWNYKGRMNHLMGKVVEIDNGDFSVNGVTVFDEKENRTWILKREEFEVFKDTYQTIVITHDGQKVIAIDKKNDKKAIARCHPDNEFDFETGVRIALDRLFGKKEENVEKEEEYKVGDFVKIKTWEQMKKEYGLDRDGDINIKHCCYVSSMKEYCGKIFVITDKNISRKDTTFVLGYDEDEPLPWCWQFPKESFECKVKAEKATFEDGYTYVFNKEKYLEYIPDYDPEHDSYELTCDGKTVRVYGKRDGKINICKIYPEWCDKYKEVERPAKVGEYIKIVNAHDIVPGGYYKNGDILKVDCCGSRVVKSRKKGVYCLINIDEYVVLDGYKPKKEELYNGKIIFTKGDDSFKTGHIYEVKDGRIKSPISGLLIPCVDSKDGLLKNIDDVKDYFTAREKRKRSEGWSNETLELVEVLDD